MVGMRNLANILFADQFPGGVPDAIAACPAAGCVIYALSPNVNLNLGTIDPGKQSYYALPGALYLHRNPDNFETRAADHRDGLRHYLLAIGQWQ